jgi:glycyl-tRNA synthetase
MLSTGAISGPALRPTSILSAALRASPNTLKLCSRPFSSAVGNKGGVATSGSRRLALDELVSFSKTRGFIFPSSEIYGAVGAGYDYGPLGTQLKKNISDKWWKDFVAQRSDCVGLDSALILNPKVWVASGHVEQFVDPLVECASCRKRVRADKLLINESKAILEAKEKADAKKKAKQAAAPQGSQTNTAVGGDATVSEAAAAAEARHQLAANCCNDAHVSALSLKELGDSICALGIKCPGCGKTGVEGLGNPRMFNLLFSTHIGPTGGSAAHAAPVQPPKEKPTKAGKAAAGDGGDGSASVSGAAYLRPETAQGVYVNFNNVIGATKRRLPLGIGQMGKSFRNEVAVGNFVFRTREFEQMELQYFCKPDESMKWHEYWVDFCEKWLLDHGLSADSIKRKVYERKELAHYALATTDLMFKFPFGWEELWGIANRGDFDLQCHSKGSGIPLIYKDPDGKEEPFYPHAVEPAVGLNRLVLAFLSDNLVEEPLPNNGGNRLVFRAHEDLAPHQIAVLPVVKNEESLVSFAFDLQQKLLRSDIRTSYDAVQTVGKRYRRQDEIGTPLCLTVDSQGLQDGTVTLRERDTMAQIRMTVEEVLERAERRKLKPSALRQAFEAPAIAHKKRLKGERTIIIPFESW